MPITENNFTDAELTAAITANPQLIDSVRTALKSKEYNLYSKDEINQYNSDLESRSVSNFVSKHASEVESTVKSITGIDKASADEKYFDYNKRVLSSIKQQRDDFEKELTTLKSKSTLSEAEKQQLETLKESVKTLTKEKETIASQMKQSQIRSEIFQSVSGVKLIEDQRPGFKRAKEILVNDVMNEIVSMSEKDQFGRIILMKDGKALMDQGGTTFMTPEKFFTEKMKENGFVDEGKQQSGAGGSSAGSDPKSVPGGAKSQVELMDYIRKANPNMKQADLVKEFDKYAAGLPVQ